MTNRPFLLEHIRYVSECSKRPKRRKRIDAVMTIGGLFIFASMISAAYHIALFLQHLNQHP